MLPSITEQELPPENEGPPKPEPIAVPQAQETETDSVKTESKKVEEKVTNDHGLTPEEADAFDELTEQVIQHMALMAAVCEQPPEEAAAFDERTEQMSQQRMAAVSEQPSVESESGNSAEEIPVENSLTAESGNSVEASRPLLKPFTYKERNMALLNLNGLSGKYWNSPPELGQNQTGRPKRTNAGAKMISLKQSKRKLEDKLEAPKRNRMAKTEVLPSTSAMALANRESITTLELPAENAPGPHVAISNLVTQIDLVTTLVTALCIPGEYSEGSDMKYEEILAECNENEDRNKNIYASQSTESGEDVAAKDCLVGTENIPSGDLTDKWGEQNCAINSIAATGSSGRELEKYYSNFNRRTGTSVATANDLSSVDIHPNSIFYHSFFFHDGKSGMCARLLRCVVKTMPFPTNWIKIKENPVETLRYMLNFKSRLVGQIATRLLVTDDVDANENARVLLSRDGFVVTFLEFSGQKHDKPKILECSPTSDKLVSFPLLVLPGTEGGMKWLFYELPADLFNMSSIWLLEIGVTVNVTGILEELKSLSSTIIQYKFKHCDQKNIKGPDYVTLSPMLPGLIIYGPVAKDCVITDPVLGLEYFNWYSEINADGHGLISLVHSHFLNCCN